MKYKVRINILFLPSAKPYGQHVVRGVRGLPDMRSALEGGGLHGKADVVREVAQILYRGEINSDVKGLLCALLPAASAAVGLYLTFKVTDRGCD